MRKRAEQERSEATAIAIGVPERSFFEQPGEERLRHVFGIGG
jgi:hypothetical protein